MVASHYAEPIERLIGAPTVLRNAPADDAETLRPLAADEPFAMLDDSLGWAWGYAGSDRRVGYVRSETLTAQ